MDKYIQFLVIDWRVPDIQKVTIIFKNRCHLEQISVTQAVAVNAK